MTNLILLIIVALAGYLLAGLIHKIPYAFKGAPKFNSPHISEKRINEILLQENHGEDIDGVVDNVKTSNSKLSFSLKNSEIVRNEN